MKTVTTHSRPPSRAKLTPLSNTQQQQEKQPRVGGQHRRWDVQAESTEDAKKLDVKELIRKAGNTDADVFSEGNQRTNVLSAHSSHCCVTSGGSKSLPLPPIAAGSEFESTNSLSPSGSGTNTPTDVCRTAARAAENIGKIASLVSPPLGKHDLQKPHIIDGSSQRVDGTLHSEAVARMAALETKGNKMKSKIKNLESELRQAETLLGKLKAIVSVALETFCVENGMTNTAEILQREAEISSNLTPCFHHGHVETAVQVLQSNILQHAQAESAKDASRGVWFQDDYKMLSQFISYHQQALYSHQTPPPDVSANVYFHWDWTYELHNFWELADSTHMHVAGKLPLYVKALNIAFPKISFVKIEDAFAAAVFQRRVLGAIEESGMFDGINYQQQQHQYHQQQQKNIQQQQMMEQQQAQQYQQQYQPPASYAWTTGNLRRKSKTPTFSGISNDGASNTSNMTISTVNDSRSMASSENVTVVNESGRGQRSSTRSLRSDADDSERRSSLSNSMTTQFTELEKLMPPLSREPETANFAKSATCPPVPGIICTIDVHPSLSASRIIVATTSTDSPRKISVWNTRAGQLVSQLDNGGHKSISCVVFHPDDPQLLITADMEFGVKLWNWESGELSSFVFWRPVDKNMGYWGRETKHFNKTPVTTIVSHPVYDNYILISCDNQLRLFDLSSETMLKTYMARAIQSGTRIEGSFSPCGTFVYSGTCDTRSLSSNSLANRRTSTTTTTSLLSPNSLDSRKGVDSDNRLGSAAASMDARGVYIWRVATGKLEVSEMRAMEGGSDSTGTGGSGSHHGSTSTAVTVCK
ncbi:hypothetical protein HK100_000587, partial [Physocladia obscura]